MGTRERINSGVKDDPTLGGLLAESIRKLRDSGHGRITIELLAREGKIVHADVTEKFSHRLDVSDQ